MTWITACGRGSPAVRLNAALALPGSIAFYRSLGIGRRRERVSPERDDFEMETERPCRT